ncbi:MAG: manganese efflux pump MntP family protein [Desulfarculaceae bacterium]|nr:manganese efflux pump MntP family protein [Desulfarculaceae bacterium]
MSLPEIVIIAVGLAMDAFAVAFSAGTLLQQIHWRHYFRLCWHFGLFQALMPVVGWSCGLGVRDLVQTYDHWIAFALLALISGGMFRSAFEDKEERKKRKDPTKGTMLVLMSLATSIDAFSVGISLSMLNVDILTPSVMIGFITAGCTAVGLYMGRIAGKVHRIGSYAEITGGAVLMAVGLKILHDHGVF